MSEATPAPESPVTEPVAPPVVPPPTEPETPPSEPEPATPPETEPAVPPTAPPPAEATAVTSVASFNKRAELGDLADGIAKIANSLPHPGVVDSLANAAKLHEYVQRIREIALTV